jgi:hypothetical protein
MSYAVEGYPYPEAFDGAVIPSADPNKRSNHARMLFMAPVVFSAASYAAGGIPPVTDLSFVLMTAFCVIFLVREMWMFPKRQGIGAIILYGGVLVWFCHDYFWNWFMIDFSSAAAQVGPDVVARCAFYHCLFIAIMVWVYEIPIFTWVDKLIVSIPEPSSPSLYLIVLLATMAVGTSPFFLAVREPFWEAFWAVVTFGTDDLHWTVGRTVTGYAQNVNYNWGGYVVQVLQIGQVAGILGATYSIMVARWLPAKLFGWACWAFWFMYSFSTYRRGDIAFMTLPVVGLLYYKYQIAAADYLKKLGWKAYAFAGLVGFGLFVAVQFQGATRDRDSLQLFKARGNTMFSEGIKAWAAIPSQIGGYYYDRAFPGEGIVRPIPELIYWFVVDPIPRALWNNKPIDPFGPWYSNFITGERSGANGTTVSGGAVGSWYFKYGPAGVIQGALVYGWLMGVCERSLRRAQRRPIGVIFALAFATFVFRSYRDLWFHILYPIMIGGAALWLLVKLFGSSRAEEGMELAPN